MARQFFHNYTLLGFVTELYPDEGCFKIRVRSGDQFYCYVNSEVWYRPLPNLFGSYDRYGGSDDGTIASKLQKYVALGARVLVEGVYCRDGMGSRVDVRTLYLLYSQHGKKICESKGRYMFEESLWWVDMITAQANTWFNNFFSDGDVNFTKYRTDLNELYEPKSKTQEVAVMSRLLYGYAVSYQLTGKEKYLSALREGVKYQRDTFRVTMPDGKTVLWASYYDGTNVVLPSNNGDDANTIPCYEQIYALAGITMYYRITGDVEALKDIMATVDAFELYFKDTDEAGGYFSHLDPDTLSPHAECLGINRSKKNWNSVGDHVPAYLINLICALSGKPGYEEESRKLHNMLLEIAEIIVAHFPSKPDDSSKLVYERFYRDWTPDLTYSWQQDRGIVGHNLKISWNLTRIAFYLGSKNRNALFPPGSESRRESLVEKCCDMAKQLAHDMDEIGGVDRFRGGCYDAIERNPTNGYDLMFAWSNTKDFWQQEQGILCYLIQMRAFTENQKEFVEMRELAASMSAFYCAYFVDLDRGGIHFRTTDIGCPIMTGMYADKGGHAKSGYHIFELCYLAHIYTALYNNPTNFTLHFAPTVAADGKLSLSFSPDFLANKSIKFGLSKAKITGKGLASPIVQDLNDFSLDIQLPTSMEGAQLKVEINLVARSHVPALEVKPVNHPVRGKFAVILEQHFDEQEVMALQKRLPEEGYEMELVSTLWGQNMLVTQGNDCQDPIRIYKDIDTVIDNLGDYACFFFVGAYCMDRLRYQSHPKKNVPNQSPVVRLVRKLAAKKLPTAAICHSLWAFVCAPEVIKGMKVTCSHNVIDDVLNAQGIVQYEKDGTDTVKTFVDDWLLTANHGDTVNEFLDVIFKYLDQRNK